MGGVEEVKKRGGVKQSTREQREERWAELDAVYG